MAKTKLALAFSLLTATSLASASTETVSSAGSFTDTVTFTVAAGQHDYVTDTASSSYFTSTGGNYGITLSSVTFLSTIYGISSLVTTSGPGYALGSTTGGFSNILVGPGTYTISIAGNAYTSGNFTNTLTLTPAAAVPEAGEWAMMLLGLPMVGWMIRRKQAV
ncbi:FxDxF family PEP-CTERM protein [Methylomonas sp. AM2-LC]|uniref:FxDxF family PEP-CTERM protein n=1 Tax=Methylomonas sp. AM2-LC TaxID=3153301 RepID=UPI0032660B75